METKRLIEKDPQLQKEDLIVLTGAGIMMFMGFMAIRRIVDIEV